MTMPIWTFTEWAGVIGACAATLSVLVAVCRWMSLGRDYDHCTLPRRDGGRKSCVQEKSAKPMRNPKQRNTESDPIPTGMHGAMARLSDSFAMFGKAIGGIPLDVEPGRIIRAGSGYQPDDDGVPRPDPPRGGSNVCEDDNQ